MTNTKPHPLEDIVLQAFAKSDHQNATSLGYFLAGAMVRPGANAYRIVAKDVLEYMKGQGKLQQDKASWYSIK
jgi:hypothetical protein